MWILKRRLANSFLWVIFFSIKIKWTSNAIGWFFGGVGLLEVVWTRCLGYHSSCYVVLNFESVHPLIPFHRLQYVKGLELQSYLVKFSKETLTILVTMFFWMINVKTHVYKGACWQQSRLCCLSLPNQVYGKHLHLNLTRDRICIYINI